MREFPGFVDLQVNGFMGLEFSGEGLSEESCRRAIDGVLAGGTAAFLPTLITSSNETFRHALRLVARVVRDGGYGNRVPGLHLEGPFLSPLPGAVGAHNPDYCRLPDTTQFAEYQDWADGLIRLVTIAAELPGAPEFIAYCRARGIVVSLGHQMAGPEDLGRAAEAGATALTHLGNGMPNMVPRHDNIIWSGLAEDRLAAMIITDGHHLPLSLVKTFIRAKGVERIIVVSDASPLAGMPPGRYETLGNTAVLAANGRLYNPEKNCLVGSSCLMPQCMDALAGTGELTAEELYTVGVVNPCRLIGLDPAELSSDRRVVYNEDARRYALA